MARASQSDRPATVYLRISEELAQKIRRGEWQPGSMLPGRKALATAYGVGTATIDRAIEALAREGMLRSEGGRGTFVARTPEQTRGVRPDGAAAGEGAESSRALAGCRLAVVVELLENEREHGFLWSWATLRALDQAVNRCGGSLLVRDRAGATRAESAAPEEVLGGLLQDRPDVVVLIGFHDPARSVLRCGELARAQGLPLIYITQNQVDAPILQVGYDNDNAGHLAARHLLEVGCRDIRFVSAYHLPWEADRLQAARRTVEATACEAHFDVLQARPADESAPASTSPELARQEQARVADWLSGQMQCGAFALKARTGIIAANDIVAYGVLDAMQRSGCAAGRDFALVGFDDRTPSSLLGLTSLRPPLEEMGVEAARLCRQVLSGDRTPRRIRLAPHLMVRSSSAGLAE